MKIITVMGLYMVGSFRVERLFRSAGWCFFFCIGGGEVSLMFVKEKGERWVDGTEKPAGVIPCGLSGFIG